MRKQFITGFISGALLCGAIGVGAAVFEAHTNSFPIQLNGENITMEGYNINGYTYFKLRDIADTVGGFSVDFANNTIQLAKDGYVYEQTQTLSPEEIAKEAVLRQYPGWSVKSTQDLGGGSYYVFITDGEQNKRIEISGETIVENLNMPSNTQIEYNMNN